MTRPFILSPPSPLAGEGVAQRRMRGSRAFDAAGLIMAVASVYQLPQPITLKTKDNSP
jgi:hypothetical protein